MDIPLFPFPSVCGFDVNKHNYFFFLASPTLAQPQVYYGKLVGTEFSVIQVRGNDGKVSVF